MRPKTDFLFTLALFTLSVSYTHLVPPASAPPFQVPVL